MPLNFSTTDKEGAKNGVKVLVYGAAGSGKTTLVSTAPAPLIISAEAGLLSLRAKSIPVIVVTNIGEVIEALAWCRTAAAKNGIKTICLDSISEISEQCLVDQKKKNKDPRAAYGELSNQIIDLVKDFRDLAGFNVVVTAKQAIITEPITNVAKAVPTAPGQQIGPALPYLFDIVMHAATDKDAKGGTYHYLRTHASFNADAKDRSGVLAEIEYPDLSNIINKIMAPPA